MLCGPMPDTAMSVYDFRFCLCAGYPQIESTLFSQTLPMIRYVIFSFFANHLS